MLFTKVIPENYGTILKRCPDLDRYFLEDFEETKCVENDKKVYYVTPMGWFNRNGISQRFSVLFTEEELENEMDFPHGKSDTDWFQATRKKS